MQTKLESLRESIDNILIGYWVALLSQLFIFPIFDIHISLMDNILIGIFFTIVSIIRSYAIRRWKNKKATCPNCGYQKI